ncbi:MAG: sulfatase-like hydrolase/transferase [Actinomycetota bacterium]
MGKNVLLVVSDQERQRDWLPADVPLPHRERLLAAGLEFTRHHTHTSPCSPSRASLFTGQYMAQHGVTENAVGPGNTELPTTATTLGNLLREQGYTTAFKGKVHLQATESPDMEAFGFGDWVGNDKSYWGLPGSGVEYDEPIALDAGDWIRAHADDGDPWFLAVGLVNPHDIMWFPVDQPWWHEANPTTGATVRAVLNAMPWGREENLPLYPFEIPERFTELPANFDDDLHTKPEVQRRWVYEMDRRQMAGGRLAADDSSAWLRQLDYYAHLHELSDQSLGHILAALDDADAWDDTVVIFTADHGDQCGSHKLRSKGPWNYDETMRIPLYVVAPGMTPPGSRCDALTSHVDLAATVAELGGVDLADSPTLVGTSLAPLFSDPGGSIQDHVLFAQDWPWYPGVEQTRYASSGIFDGRFKYCRYYGIGGGADVAGNRFDGPKAFDLDADFDDFDHELYDLQEDPHELVNLALDRARRDELRRRFAELNALERVAYAPLPD